MSTRSAASTAAGASVLRPGGVSMMIRSQSAVRARRNVSSRSFSVVNCTNGSVSSPARRRRQLVEFCWVSISRMRTARPARAAAVARLREIMVFPAPPLLMVTAIVFMPVCACAVVQLCTCAARAQVQSGNPAPIRRSWSIARLQQSAAARRQNGGCADVHVCTGNAAKERDCDRSGSHGPHGVGCLPPHDSHDRAAKVLPFESWCRTNHCSGKGSAARRTHHRRRTRRTRPLTTLLLTSYRAIVPMYLSAGVHTCNRTHDRLEGQGPQKQENRPLGQARSDTYWDGSASPSALSHP